RGDHHPVAAVLAEVVSHGGREVERGDAEGGAGLHDPARAERTAELVAELRLVAVERDELVAQEAVVPLFEAAPVEGAFAGAGREVGRERIVLRGAARVQAVEQGLEARIAEQAQMRRSSAHPAGAESSAPAAARRSSIGRTARSSG